MKKVIEPKSLTVKQVPVPPNDHPDPPSPQLMKHEFTCGLIAPKGAGKTTVICNLLAFYKNYFHTILVFSPTIDSDEKWDWVKAQELVIENIPLKKWIRKMSDQKKKESIVQPAPVSDAFEGLVNARDKFTGHIPEEHFFNDYDDETFRNIMEEQMQVIKLLKKHGETKYLANR
jgi:hypothetical protein